MKKLFCKGCKARNNEEYRVVLKRRQKKMFLSLLAGVLTVVLGIVCIWLDSFEDSYQIGLVLGFGAGLALGTVIRMIKILKVLKSEERLKEERLRETDEREREVGNQSLRLTVKITLAVLYIFLIAGGLFLEVIMMVCCILIGVFLLSYEIAKKYYEKQM